MLNPNFHYFYSYFNQLFHSWFKPLTDQRVNNQSSLTPHAPRIFISPKRSHRSEAEKRVSVRRVINHGSSTRLNYVRRVVVLHSGAAAAVYTPNIFFWPGCHAAALPLQLCVMQVKVDCETHCTHYARARDGNGIARAWSLYYPKV